MSLGRHFGNVVAAIRIDRTSGQCGDVLTLQPFLVHGGVLNTRTHIHFRHDLPQAFEVRSQLAEFFAPHLLQEGITKDARTICILTSPS